LGDLFNSVLSRWEGDGVHVCFSLYWILAFFRL